MSPSTLNASAHRGKRVRMSRHDDPKSPMSDASTVMPASAVEPAVHAASDSESDLSESSEEPSDDSSSESESENEAESNDTDEELEEHEGRDGLVSLRANRGKKPTMKLDKDNLGPDIRQFLKDFLPQLKLANEELEAQKKAGTLRDLEADAGENGEQYIEMDLGLGVLEAKRDDASSSSDCESDECEAEKKPESKDIVAKLMGRKSTASPARIQVVQGHKSP